MSGYGIILTLAFLSTKCVSFSDGKSNQVVTDHAVYKGEKLIIGNDGNGSCKYTGERKIQPAWVLRNSESTYAVSAGRRMLA